ncbi:MAG: choice-of-anchor J domain-containing protein, partial [Bacteroidales bacterium]|nr:choice-of-anchor J domain-containing protein [Bacteroidales bacterium]
NQLFATFDDILIKTDFVDFVDFTVTEATSPNIILDSTISIIFQNLGSLEVPTPISISYKMNNAATVTAPYDLVPIAGGEIRTFTFPEKIGFPVGKHTIKIWVNYDLDNNRANDTLTYVVDINPLADTFRLTFEEMVDFSENFYPWTNLDLDKSLSYNIGSINEPLSYTKEWQRIGFIAFNPYATIPPSTNRFQAKEGIKFGASIGVWDPTKQSNKWLISPPITPNGDFNYVKLWVKSSSASSLERYRVLVSTTDNDPASFVSLTTDTLEAPAVWTEVAFGLNEYIGQPIYVAIQCLSFDGHVFMVDDIHIVTNEAAFTKASVVDVFAPSSYPKLPFDQVEVSVSIANQGNQNALPTSVSYKLNNDAVVTQNYSGSNIAWREKGIHTFNAKINIDAPGIHVLKAWVNGFAETDTLTQNIYINANQNSMFLDFEDAYDFTSVLRPWANFDEDGLQTITFNLTLQDNISYPLNYPGAGEPQSFLVFNPAKTSIPTLPSYIVPVSGQRIGISVRPVTGASSDYLISPKVTLLNGASEVSFHARGLTSAATEKFRVLVSTTGTSPADFTVVSGSTPIEVKTATWTKYSYDISSYARQNVHIAIQCISDATGAMFMIDDIEIYTSDEGSIEDNVRAEAIKLTPNPANSVVKISSATPIKESVIYNVSGKEVLRSTATTIQIDSLPTGIYIVKTLLSDGTISVSKLIKN